MKNVCCDRVGHKSSHSRNSLAWTRECINVARKNPTKKSSKLDEYILKLVEVKIRIYLGEETSREH